MRIGMLTGGGDCPGLNAVIRAVVTKGEGVYGHEIVGFRHGWRGLIEDETMDLSVSAMRTLSRKGGTVLGTSRTNPFKSEDGVARLLDTLQRQRIDALIAIGGEDTLGVAAKLGEQGVLCVGVPKTIDNDLSGTDYTFGFQTAVSKPTERSVPQTSLSIVFGAHTMRTPASASVPAALRVPSPPTQTSASMRSCFTVSSTASIPPSASSGW